MLLLYLISAERIILDCPGKSAEIFRSIPFIFHRILKKNEMPTFDCHVKHRLKVSGFAIHKFKHLFTDFFDFLEGG